MAGGRAAGRRHLGLRRFQVNVTADVFPSQLSVMAAGFPRVDLRGGPSGMLPCNTLEQV